MTLQIEIRDLRKVIMEKCEELITDKQLAHDLYLYMCGMEDDVRFSEIIQCKDCRHSEQIGCNGYRCFMWDYNSVQAEGFCNYGERSNKQ